MFAPSCPLSLCSQHRPHRSNQPLRLDSTLSNSMIVLTNIDNLTDLNVMLRPQARNRKERGREASESTEESDAILRRKMNNSRVSLRRTKLTPARRRRRSARPNARRRPVSDWYDPNLNPGFEDLRPPSSESESESSFGEEEDKEYEEMSGLGPWTAAMRQEDAPGSLHVRAGDSIPSGLRGGTNSDAPGGDLSSTAPALPLSKEDKLKERIAGIESWVKILGDREANWKRVKAAAKRHLAATTEAWNTHHPFMHLKFMRALPHNTPPYSRLVLWLVGSTNKKESAGKELKLVQSELARAKHCAGVLEEALRGLSVNTREDAVGPQVAEAERYAEWAYRQTLRGNTGFDSTQPYHGAVRKPDPNLTGIDVDLDAGSEKGGDEQRPSLRTPEIVDWTRPAVIDLTSPAQTIDLTASTQANLPINTEETLRPGPRRTTGPDQRWDPSLGLIRFNTPRSPPPPDVGSEREQESTRRKRKREGDGGPKPEGAGGTDASRDGGDRPSDGAETDPKRRKVQDDVAAYEARELKKINEESAAWEAGLLNWVSVKAKHLFE
ncbi:hypothetical protein PspLS_09547 [Pyricularia sp. CBS 133598]|nr:hypothetical protein PspLS_09547 [Pyricularia sp. CBS 133598]